MENKEQFIVADKTADDFLKIIHFKRLRNETVSIVDIKFLCDKYLELNDVRFFNELLWLENKKYIDLSVEHFYQLLDNKERHKYYYGNEFKYCLNIESDNVCVKESDFENKKICLIGVPFHFLLAFRKLRKLKANVEIVNITFYSNPKINFIINNALIKLFYKIYFGSKRYKEIQVKSKSQLKLIKLEKTYDIGFHKLNFIISEDLIKKFKIGLINDHWAALPLFKGRSTIDYSRLFGAELIISNHLVHKEIDSGSIILYTKINRNKMNKSIYYGIGDRIVKSISLLSTMQVKNIDNSQGKMFYEMHPFIKNHVKIHKL